jgi:hypothetical protein
MLQLLAICKRSVHPVTNPNPVYSHFIHVIVFLVVTRIKIKLSLTQAVEAYRVVVKDPILSRQSAHS